ncbi:MAG: HAMP domain-containing protein [Acidobacteria bacterium]|nr:HAMP domain-containing protein [Acidobacteriota bacterium]
MKKKRENIRGLERKLLSYFLLIAVAALMIGIEFAIEMNSLKLKQELWEAAGKSSISTGFNENSPMFEPIYKIRTKIIIMFGVLTLVVAIVLIMFIRNITTPLQKMVNAADRIVKGDLSQVVEVESRDEIATLGQAINDLTSNLQEVAAHVQMMSADMLIKIDEIKKDVGKTKDKSSNKQSKELLNKLQSIETDIEALRDISDSFKLLKTEIKKD